MSTVEVLVLEEVLETLALVEGMGMGGEEGRGDLRQRLRSRISELGPCLLLGFRSRLLNRPGWVLLARRNECGGEE